jgi:hypothetical protein
VLAGLFSRAKHWFTDKDGGHKPLDSSITSPQRVVIDEPEAAFIDFQNNVAIDHALGDIQELPINSDKFRWPEYQAETPISKTRSLALGSRSIHDGGYYTPDAIAINSETGDQKYETFEGVPSEAIETERANFMKEMGDKGYDQFSFGSLGYIAPVSSDYRHGDVARSPNKRAVITIEGYNLQTAAKGVEQYEVSRGAEGIQIGPNMADPEVMYFNRPLDDVFKQQVTSRRLKELHNPISESGGRAKEPEA